MNFDDISLSKFQDNIGDAFTTVLSCPEFFSVYLLNVSLTAGKINIVSHKLGRKFLGWSVVDINVPASISRVSDDTPTLTLSLQTTANCIVTIKAF